MPRYRLNSIHFVTIFMVAVDSQRFGEMAQHVLAQIHKHPTMKLVRELVAKLSQTLGLNFTLFDTQVCQRVRGVRGVRGVSGVSGVRGASGV